MEYCINYNTPFPVFQINETIGVDEKTGNGIDGKKLSREFFEVDAMNPKVITYYNNCLGGDVQEGLDIFNAIINSRSKTRSVGNGFMYSTDGWIFLAADIVDMYEHSSWMCHMPFSESDSPVIRIAANMIATVLASKSGRNGKPKKTQKDILDLMKGTTYFDATQMYNEGLINNILNSDNKKINPTDTEFDISNEYQIQKKIFNSLIIPNQEKKSEKMENIKILNKLGLVTGSDQDDIIAGIARIENRANIAENEVKSFTEKLRILNEEKSDREKRLAEMEDKLKKSESEKAKMKNDMDEMDNKHKAIENELKSIKDEKEMIENKAKEEKADAFIKNAIEIGKIKNDAELIKVLKSKHISDPIGTELIIGAQPVTKKMPFPIDNQGNPVKIDNSGLPLDATPEQFHEYNRKKRESQNK